MNKQKQRDMITGTLKEIPLGGLASTPSDYDCQDGEMVVCHNMVGGKGVAEATVVKVGEGEDAQELPEMEAGAELVFVHNTSFGKVYIIKSTWIDATTGEEYKCLRYHKGVGFTWELLYICETDGIALTAVGNMLIVNVLNEGLHYIRYKSDVERYKYLGTDMPDINAVFGLENVSDQTVTEKYIAPTPGNTGEYEIRIGDTSEQFGDSPVHVYEEIIKTSDFPVDKEKDEVVNPDMLFASVNKVITKCREKSIFIKPFFVRCAYELYDGNYVMQSSPVLMVPDNDLRFRVYGDYNIIGFWAQSRISTYFTPTKLMMKTSIREEEIEDWKDIIQSVAIFVTPEISNYSASGDVECAKIRSDFAYQTSGLFRLWNNSRYELRTSDVNVYAYDSGSYDFKMLRHDGSLSDWCEQEISNFRLLKKYTLDEIVNMNSFVRVARKGGIVNLNVFEQLIDGYRVRTKYNPSYLHTYNNRLNLANLTLSEREEFPIGFLSSYSEGYNGIDAADVYIEEDGVWNKVQGNVEQSWAVLDKLSGFFYYPNPNAKFINLKYGGISRWIRLKPHATLNGAFYLNESLIGLDGEYGKPTEVPDDVPIGAVVPKPNWLVTSEVDNPFVFPALGVNQIGSGKIKAIKSATKAMSEGTAFGAQPLYVFTEDGIFALSVNGVGLYDRAAPVSRETVSDASKVLSIDNSVIFISDHGLMELNGSRTRCLSEKLTDRWSSVDLLGLTSWGLVAAKLGDYGIACDFMDYIKGNARLAFDYVNYRIYVFSDEKYAYVYDIGTKQWSTCASSMHSSVEGFPATFINIKQFDENGRWIGTKVCQFSSDDSELVDDGHVLWLTRPLKFGEHDVLKTVRRVIARGRFSDKDNLTLALWGSRNMMDWVYVGGVKKGVNLPRLSGSPYKYFIVGGSAKMSNEDMLSRLTIEKSERYLNKPR